MKYITYKDDFRKTCAGVLTEEGRVVDLTRLLHAHEPIYDIGQLLDEYENADIKVREAICMMGQR